MIHQHSDIHIDPSKISNINQYNPIIATYRNRIFFEITKGLKRKVRHRYGNRSGAAGAAEANCKIRCTSRRPSSKPWRKLF